MSQISSRLWATTRFSRSQKLSRAWVLIGLPQDMFERVCARLFMQGGQLIATGSSRTQRLAWIVFRCPAKVSGRLALLFPAPVGVPPLLVSPKGHVLYGEAERKALCAGPHGSPSLEVTVQYQVILEIKMSVPAPRDVTALIPYP